MVNTIDTRAYHSNCAIKTPYHQWMRYTIDRLGLSEGQDYLKIRIEEARVGRPSFIFFVTPPAFDRIMKEPKWQRK